jgi:hypothetical protein
LAHKPGALKAQAPSPAPCPAHPAPQYCDRGSLRDAVRGGMFHRPLPNGAIGVDLAAVVEVLLDASYAVQYLHSMGLVHGDIKVGLRGAGGRPASIQDHALRLGPWWSGSQESGGHKSGLQRLYSLNAGPQPMRPATLAGLAPMPLIRLRTSC